MTIPTLGFWGLHKPKGYLGLSLSVAKLCSLSKHRGGWYHVNIPPDLHVSSPQGWGQPINHLSGYQIWHLSGFLGLWNGVRWLYLDRWIEPLWSVTALELPLRGWIELLLNIPNKMSPVNMGNENYSLIGWISICKVHWGTLEGTMLYKAKDRPHPQNFIVGLSCQDPCQLLNRIRAFKPFLPSLLGM